ncbi:hypothetical protein LCGC14_1451840 [marine sediment metagenome]|uniref:Uncharacterized protein n=1 Tax=marine sediment metagenome TaxID=412755 RepID=A0A0F9JIE6_9ZZZZ
MKAKDTVIKLNCGGILSDIEVEYYNRGAEAQAEISFTAGQREVVEWVDDNIWFVAKTEPQSMWQAFKKERGL